jgi:hypothetical protein
LGMPRPNLARSSRLDNGIRQCLTETASVRDFWNILPNVDRMKLTAYVLEGHELDIRPAPVERGWMDATGDSFAYR